MDCFKLGDHCKEAVNKALRLFPDCCLPNRLFPDYSYSDLNRDITASKAMVNTCSGHPGDSRPGYLLWVSQDILDVSGLDHKWYNISHF